MYSTFKSKINALIVIVFYVTFYIKFFCGWLVNSRQIFAKKIIIELDSTSERQRNYEHFADFS